MIVNLTPHSISIVGGPEIPPSGKIVRVGSTIQRIGEVEGIPLTCTTYGKPGVEIGNRWDGELPEPQPGVWYVVSALAAQACPDRKDFLIPNETVRNEKGQIIGCKSLAVLAR